MCKSVSKRHRRAVNKILFKFEVPCSYFFLVFKWAQNIIPNAHSNFVANNEF